MKVPGPQPRNLLERGGLSAAEVLGAIGLMSAISVALGHASVSALWDLVIALAVGAWVFLRLSRWSAGVALLLTTLEVGALAYQGRNVVTWLILFFVAFGANQLKPKDATAMGDPAVPPPA